MNEELVKQVIEPDTEFVYDVITPEELFLYAINEDTIYSTILEPIINDLSNHKEIDWNKAIDDILKMYNSDTPLQHDFHLNAIKLLKDYCEHTITELDECVTGGLGVNPTPVLGKKKKIKKTLQDELNDAVEILNDISR